MENVRLRAPARHGEALFRPRVDSLDLFEQNVREVASIEGELATIRQLAREEILAAALEYTRRYCDVIQPAAEGHRIVMGGHQPTLFHPGVWLKNFTLSRIGESANALSVNLVVDNDLYQSATLGVPVLSGNQVTLERIAFDQADAVKPFELRPILQPELFRSFGERIAKTISPIVSEPLIGELWPKVIEASPHVGGNLGASIAAGRHLLEKEHGMMNLELPISELAGTKSFARFFAMIATDPFRFADAYNMALQEYRETHGIRSNSHPVPALGGKDDWQEIPFWCWTADDHKRGRMFVRRPRNGRVEVSNLDRWSAKVSLSDLQSGSLDDVMPKVSIRTRALTTTMFARLFGCDLFVHGIGGAKYDQLTERIVQKFFDVSLPGHLTCTATMRLPFSQQAVTQQDVDRLRLQFREMKFHPEKFLGQQAEEEVKQKRGLLGSMPTEGSRKQWHDQIESINARLSGMLDDEKNRVQAELDAAREGLAMGRLINSREFGFPLFTTSLVAALRGLSTEY